MDIKAKQETMKQQDKRTQKVTKKTPKMQEKHKELNSMNTKPGWCCSFSSAMEDGKKKNWETDQNVKSD